MKLIKHRNGERGQAALEGAIILIAFVVMASVFAFAILSAGTEVTPTTIPPSSTPSTSVCSLTFSDLFATSATITNAETGDETEANVDEGTIHIELPPGVYWVTATSEERTALGIAVVYADSCITSVAPH